MFKFRGFRASLDFLSGKQRQESHVSHSPISIGGAYKINRDEYGVNDYAYNSPTKPRPSKIQLPNTIQTNNERVKSKSTTDLTSTTYTNVQVSRSSCDVSQNARASKRQAREQKKLEKQQLVEQKKQEKIAEKERQKQEKLAKERIKQDSLGQGRQPNERPNCRKKKTAPQPPQTHSMNNQAPSNTDQIHNDRHRLQNNRQQSQTTQGRQTGYLTNTLESSISRSSGPPPYGEYPEIIIDDGNTGNITFGKAVDYHSSWDLISQHREQMSKPISSAPIAPRRKKDLQYKVGNLQIGNGNDNSDA